MTDTKVTFETNEQLREFLGFCLPLGIGIPQLRIWCKITTVNYEDTCPLGLGDETKPISEQFYGVEIDNDVYVVLGRGSTSSDGIPTGNFKESTVEELSAWVAEFGLPSIHLDYPRQEEVI